MHLQLTLSFLLLSVLVSWSSLINAAPLLSDRSKDAIYLDIEIARSPKPPACVTELNISGGVDSGGTGRRGFQSRDQEQPDIEMPAPKLIPGNLPVVTEPKQKPESPPTPSLPPTPKLVSPSTNGSSDAEQEDD
ncbi:hypothetical protein DFH08DRAFT_951133 [Mycena albidolilacea]|uniref:Uncharacterized protein n=1 Tax=Mycena albidolilacea TaxID=1033008 RepID=A0AAD7F1F1_9AGAR|nr:hypothetical protein DFH08DRAFT_951133 [Mycena albidolilacea]